MASRTGRLSAKERSVARGDVPAPSPGYVSAARAYLTAHGPDGDGRDTGPRRKGIDPIDRAGLWDSGWNIETRPGAKRQQSSAKTKADNGQLRDILGGVFDDYLREHLGDEEWQTWEDRQRHSVAEIIEQTGVPRRTLMRRRASVMAKAKELWYELIGPWMADGEHGHRWLIRDARFPWREHKERHD